MKLKFPCRCQYVLPNFIYIHLSCGYSITSIFYRFVIYVKKFIVNVLTSLCSFFNYYRIWYNVDIMNERIDSMVLMLIFGIGIFFIIIVLLSIVSVISNQIKIPKDALHQEIKDLNQRVERLEKERL